MIPNIYVHCNNNRGRRPRFASPVSRGLLSECDEIELTASFSKGSATSL